VAVAWADGRYGNPDVFFRRVDASSSGPLPYAPAVAIERLIPNPTALTFRADLALAGDPNARLEVADLAGRIVHRQDLGAFGSGRHSTWVTLANVPAGVYWVRVVESDRSQAKRIALVR
jgi:hypothetical protein